ncbi:MAG TPA: S8 family serine peptidase [Halalkalibaculum sp.]|nr:S8 family serine peptidase [Halalkalibaculum sp.]
MGKLYLKLSLILFLGIALASCDSSIVDQSTPSDLNSGTADQQLATSEGDIIQGEYLMLFKGNKIPKNFERDIEAAGATIIYQHDSGFAYVSDLSEDAASTFSARKDVAEFAANTSFSLNLQGEALTVNADFVTNSPEDPAGAFFFARQWHHRAIEADKAWDAGLLGDEDVTLAILDGGIDYTNLDLAGLVDLSRSASFVPTDDALVDFYFPGRNYITDLQFHGTHVAATAVSNGLIGAGITSKTTLTGIKVCDVFGDCNFGAIFSGLFYATETGVDVANMSLGGAFVKAGNGQFVGFINSLMNTLRRSNITVVVSAGNSSIDLDKNGNAYSVFCDSPNVICVSATGPTASAGTNGPWTDVDAPAFYTNFGRSAIDVAAPGGNTGAPVWATCTQTSLVVPVCQTGNFIVGLSGTSMAAPHVSGLAALLVSQGVSKPSQVKARILQSADDLGQKGTDKFYGKGRINVANALGL